jgi:hypothetical protein
MLALLLIEELTGYDVEAHPLQLTVGAERHWDIQETPTHTIQSGELKNFYHSSVAVIVHWRNVIYWGDN